MLIFLMYKSIDILVNLYYLLIEGGPIKFLSSVGGFLVFNVGHVQFQIPLNNFG